jgi:CRP-like cAMP-binding protein
MSRRSSSEPSGDSAHVVRLDDSHGGQSPGPAEPEFYVVVKGEVAISQQVDNKSVLIDVCDGGDIFGVRALLADRRGIRTLGELLAR